MVVVGECEMRIQCKMAVVGYLCRATCSRWWVGEDEMQM